MKSETSLRASFNDNFSSGDMFNPPEVFLVPNNLESQW